MPDIFLKFDPAIDGGSQNVKFLKWIEIESFTWGLDNVPSDGKVDPPAVPQQVSLVGRVDRQSPKLFEACAKGTPFASAELVLVSDGQDAQPYYKAVFKDALITSYQVSGVESLPGPSENYTLTFQQIENEFSAQREDGSLEPPITGAYDFGSPRKA
jgi:type VI secretion system secreted protein Hcp